VSLVTATYPPRTSLRPCRLYRFYVEHPLTGEIVLGYVGETGRQAWERLLEHLATQPWFDTVVRWEVDPQVFYGKTAVLEAETAAIRVERPLYNVVGNERNEKRIIPPTAIRQRRERDARNNEARWVHPNDRGTDPRPRVPVRQKRSEPKLWQKRLTGWACTWPTTTLVVWLLEIHWHLGGWKQTLLAAALFLPGFVSLTLLVLSQTAKKRTRRKLWRWLFGWPR
jgi:hypothetical protein